MNIVFSYIYGIVCIIVWSFIPLVSRLGQNITNPFQFLMLTNLFSFLAVGIFLLPNIKNVYKYIKQTNFFISFIVGFLGCFFYYLCLYYGYSKGSSINVLVIQYLWPAIIFILGVFIFKEKITIKSIVAIILGLAASIIAISSVNSKAMEVDYLKLLVVFIGAISFALYSILTKLDTCESNIFSVCIYFFWAFLLSLITYIFFGKWIELNNISLTIILLNGIFINGISYLLWKIALKKAYVTKIAPLVYLTPILSMIWIHFFLKEPIKIGGFIAIGFIILSGILLIKKKN